MRAITKGSEPPNLTEYRRSVDAKYEYYQHKEELKKVLVKEQRGICCYCMGAISVDSGGVKIEHWHSQSCYKGEQLIYTNLLAACRGGEGQPQHMQHCDTRKGNRDLKFNPADPLHPIEKLIGYSLVDGSIFSGNEEFNSQLNDVLGLNLPRFKNQRKKIIHAMLEWREIYKRKHGRPVPREILERERRRLTSESLNQLEAYSPVAVWWLDLRLSKFSKLSLLSSPDSMRDAG